MSTQAELGVREGAPPKNPFQSHLWVIVGVFPGVSQKRSFGNIRSLLAKSSKDLFPQICELPSCAVFCLLHQHHLQNLTMTVGLFHETTTQFPATWKGDRRIVWQQEVSVSKERGTLSALHSPPPPLFLPPPSFCPAISSSHLLTPAGPHQVPLFTAPSPEMQGHAPEGLFPGTTSPLSAPLRSNQLPESLRNCFSARGHQIGLEEWSVMSTVGKAISLTLGI